jgi:hypothetical protein
MADTVRLVGGGCPQLLDYKICNCKGQAAELAVVGIYGVKLKDWGANSFDLIRNPVAGKRTSKRVTQVRS